MMAQPSCSTRSPRSHRHGAGPARAYSRLAPSCSLQGVPLWFSFSKKEACENVDIGLDDKGLDGQINTSQNPAVRQNLPADGLVARIPKDAIGKLRCPCGRPRREVASEFWMVIFASAC